MENANSTTDHSLINMNYIQVTGDGEQNDASAMDDFQLMEALLDNDGSFVDAHQEPGGSHLGAMGLASAAIPTSASAPMPAIQNTQQPGTYKVPAAGAPVQPVAPNAQVLVSQQVQIAQAGASTTLNDAEKQKQGAITPSPLTARLNFTYAAAQYHPSMPPATASIPPTTTNAVQRVQPTATGETKSLRKRSTPTTTSTRKRGRDSAVSAISEDEGEKERRRQDRNLREQQRSHKITEQISHLREVLAAANIHFKPDKYSTLVSVVDYIKQLQSRSSMLDSEHKKLIETISRTNEVVNSPYFNNCEGDAAVGSDLLSDAPSGCALEDETAVFVQGLDYKNVFRQCGIALAIASIDGRFMDCNPEFELLTGYSRDELLPGEELDSGDVPTSDPTPSSPEAVTSSDSGVPSTVTTTSKRNLSLFNLLARKDMEHVFLAMSRMLKQPVGGSLEQDRDRGEQQDCWSGQVVQSRSDKADVSVLALVCECAPCLTDKSAVLQVQMNVTLVRSPMGRPKFFQCALTPAA